MNPADQAAAQLAFQRGYAAEDERQRYFQANPGVPIGWDPDPDPWRPPPAGLGYSRAPRADAIYEADAPGFTPHVLPVPVPFDASAPASVTGSSHGWAMTPGPGIGSPGSGVVFASPGPPPRRSLWARLTGRGR